MGTAGSLPALRRGDDGERCLGEGKVQTSGRSGARRNGVRLRRPRAAGSRDRCRRPRANGPGGAGRVRGRRAMRYDCASCGAPLEIEPDAVVVVCRYCRSTSHRHPSGPGSRTSRAPWRWWAAGALVLLLVAATTFVVVRVGSRPGRPASRPPVQRPRHLTPVRQRPRSPSRTPAARAGPAGHGGEAGPGPAAARRARRCAEQGRCEEGPRAGHPLVHEARRGACTI